MSNNKKFRLITKTELKGNENMFKIKDFSPIKNIPVFLSVITIIAFFIIFFFYCNVINSGYKLNDDHEIYYFSSIITQNNFLEILNTFLEIDGRFRPIYWVYRTILFFLFKANFFLWYLGYFVMAIISSLMLFFISKKFLPVFISLLITAFTFLSCEYNIYLGLGFGELFSCTLLVASVFFIIFPDNKFKKLKNILSFSFLLLAIYSKETFLIAGPFIIWLKVLLESKESKSAIKDNITYISLMSFFIILGLVFNIIAENSADNYSLVWNLKNILLSFFDIINSVKYLTVEFIGLFIFSILGLVIIKQRRKEYFQYLLLSFLLLFTQLLFLSLISKDNAFQVRYLFPAYFAGTILLISLFYFVKNKLFQILLCIFLTISVFYNANVWSLRTVKDISNINIAFNKTIENTKKILPKDATILLVGDAVSNMEYFESLVRNYNYDGFKEIYLLPLINKPEKDLTPFEKRLCDFFPEKYSKYLFKAMKKEPQLVIVFKSENEELYKSQSGIDFSKYKDISIKYSNTYFYINENRTKKIPL